MICLLVDPHRQTIETIDFTQGVPDPSHPATAQAQALLGSRYVDSQMMPDGDLVAFHLDDLLTPEPTGAMIDGCLTFGYALITPGNPARPLRTDADALLERIQWIADIAQATAAVKHLHF